METSHMEMFVYGNVSVWNSSPTDDTFDTHHGMHACTQLGGGGGGAGHEFVKTMHQPTYCPFISVYILLLISIHKAHSGQ